VSSEKRNEERILLMLFDFAQPVRIPFIGLLESKLSFTSATEITFGLCVYAGLGSELFNALLLLLLGK
jgi:hypothetical protein